jgi:regulator of PEP synthase PpsR (kinase-PPPase family)
MKTQPQKYFNLHLISDSTGETVTLLSKAITSQFPHDAILEHHHFLVKNASNLEKIIEEIKRKKGIILYTVSNENLEKMLESLCEDKQILCIPVVSNFVKKIAEFWDIKPVRTAGKQHEISEEYYKKMEAMNYTLAHDDGNLADELHDADIIILGVSRSSKSPTSIYLGYKGYKVGNIPFVRAELIPSYIKTLKKPLIVGFTIDPERLKAIRQTRVKILAVKEETEYTDLMTIKEEVSHAKKFFASLEIPVINVTEKSIEETAVYVINLFEEKHHKIN